jgi:hypothetical protein
MRTFSSWLITFLLLSLHATEVPMQLPRPDGSTGDTSKPVKVYVLAGQSNMVGFGALKSRGPMYSNIYLSPDPSIRPGRMPVGEDALLPCGLFQGGGKSTKRGGTAYVFKAKFTSNEGIPVTKASKVIPFEFGTASAQLPQIAKEYTLVVKSFIEVPYEGKHEIHIGFRDSTYAVAVIDGKEVYRKEEGKASVVTPIFLDKNKRYPITVTYQKGGSAAIWLKHIELKGSGDLTTVMKEGNFTWFGDEEGQWTTRKDVYYIDTRLGTKVAVPLSPRVNAKGKFLGPEIPFGYVMGTFHDEQVLLIESSVGNRSINFDYRPPSSGRDDPEDNFEGLEYRNILEGVQKTLGNLKEALPGYEGQGYEIVGFVWFQGHKDGGRSKEEYEKHLTNLIKDLRRDLKAPNMKVAVASVGFDGMNMGQNYLPILHAQMAVGDPIQHPEFKGSVASIDTRSFWRNPGVSPTGVGYHYNHNAETYALTGDGLGRAMVRLLGGKTEDVNLPPMAPKHPDVELIYSTDITNKNAVNDKKPTQEQYRLMTKALEPMVLESLIPTFIEGALGESGRVPPDTVYRHIRKLSSQHTLKKLLGLEKNRSKNPPQSLYSQLDSLIRHYNAIGVHEYDWKPFGKDTRKAEWSYISFDPPEKQEANLSGRLRNITLPSGSEKWLEKGFNPETAGWKKGNAPFGQSDGKQLPRPKLKEGVPNCYMEWCQCDELPGTLWEKEVLIMHRTFEVPKIKDGHLYRMILGGAGCDRSGEGFSIYVNGKLLKESKGGYVKNAGIRGAYITGELLNEFKKGQVDVAILNHLRYTHMRNGTQYLGKPVPPNGQVTAWLEEVKLPAVVVAGGVE